MAQNFESFLEYIAKLLSTKVVCVIFTINVTFIPTRKYLLSYPSRKYLFEGILQNNLLKEVRIWQSTY